MSPSVQFCVSELTTPWELELVTAQEDEWEALLDTVDVTERAGLFLGRKHVFDLSQSCGLHVGGH